jgi:uncharacterized membrane protein
MSTALAPSTPPFALAAHPAGVVRGVSTEGVRSHWALKRNCSMAPSTVCGVFATLCAVSLGIATAFWWLGATLVLPFAVIELAAVGAAIVLYGRHAGDGEWLRLDGGRLVLDCRLGPGLQRYEFDAHRVRLRRCADGLIGLTDGREQARIGRFVTRAERMRLVDELGAALAEVRRRLPPVA